MAALEGVNGTVCNVLRYQQSLSSATSLNPSISCLTHGRLATEASLISVVCLVIIFILIGRNVLRYRKVSPDGEWKLLRFPTDIFMPCAAHTFHIRCCPSYGGILNVRWAGSGMVTTGPYCTAQGIIKQIGELGTALITLRCGEWVQARGFTFGLVGFACVFIALWVGIGNGYWCWISPQFKGERFAGEYLWLWVALFASILYIPVYLWANGRLSVGERWYKFRLSKPDQEVESPQRRSALGCFTLFFGLAMFNLSGAINVLLFLIVRPQILLFAPPEQPVEAEKQLSHLNTGPVVLTETAGCERSPEPTGRGSRSTQRSASNRSRAQV
ncbi:hypothetical protein BC826DRAFT_1002120 [Russula brevipes]|nr:hypothetical protein BC826DRAFT_1002120 [Russula brevipes]